jgi:hypothetical protein
MSEWTFHLLLGLCFAAGSNQALGYNKQRHDASIQADLNKLYDTRPTSGSFISDVFSRNNVQRAATSQKVNEASASEDENNSAAPYFDLNHSGNVTAVLGKTALLNCRVKNIGNKTVSWMRHDDTQLLAIGRLTYTSDMRFKAIHKLYSEDYLLQIKPTTHRDNGKYTCQISTTPPVSHMVSLTIAEPKTAILGGPDIHLKEGSTMNLSCIITDSPEPPSYIFWRHDDAIISYDSPRGGVSVITEKGDVTASFLVVQHAKPTDSGTYSCSPSLGDTVSVNVHVLRGEYIARLGTNDASMAKNVLEYVTLLFSLLFTSSLII